MTRIIKSEKVQMICPKHGFVDHWEYIKEDGNIVYKCTFCYREQPFLFPVYGRPQPRLDIPKREEPKYGRLVV